MRPSPPTAQGLGLARITNLSHSVVRTLFDFTDLNVTVVVLKERGPHHLSFVELETCWRMMDAFRSVCYEAPLVTL